MLGLPPNNHLVVDDASGVAMLSTGRSPSELVESMFAEMHSDYATAVRRAMLDYDLRSTSQRNHHGIDVSALDVARWTPRPQRSREELGIDPVSVPGAGQRLARRLFAKTPLALSLTAIWDDPTRGCSHLVRILDAESSGFRRRLPLTVADLHRLVADSADAARQLLRTRWHRECVEVVAAFMLEGREALASAVRVASDRRSRDAPAPGAATPIVGRLRPGAARQSRTAGGSSDSKRADEDSKHEEAAGHDMWSRARVLAFPQERDVLRFARQVDEARRAVELEHQRRVRMIVPYGRLMELADAHPGGGAPDAAATLVDELVAIQAYSSAMRTPRDLPPIDPVTPLVPGGAILPTPLASLRAVERSLVTPAPEIDGPLGLPALAAHRLEASLNAAASLMSIHLRSAIYQSLDAFHGLLQSFLPPPSSTTPAPVTAGLSTHSVVVHADAHTHGHSSHHTAAGHASGPAPLTLTDPCPQTDGVFDGLPSEDLRAPLLRAVFALEYGEGSTGGAGAPLPVTYVEPAEAAPAGAAAAAAAAPPSGPPQRPPIKDVDLEGQRLPLGEMAASFWAGSVTAVLDPTWEALEAALVRCVTTILSAGAGMPRAETEIRKYAEQGNGDEDEGDGDADAEGDEDEDEDGSGHANASDAGRLLRGRRPGAPAGDGSSGNARRRKLLSTVPRWDEHAMAARELAAAVVAANMAGPERLLARFRRFEALFGLEEKRRLVAFCTDRSKRVKDYVAELARLQKIDQAICSCGSHFDGKDPASGFGREVFRLVEIDTTPLVDALRARVRLHATAIGHTLKYRLVSTCLTINDRFAYLEQRCEYRPRNSDELVEHAQFARVVPDEMMTLKDRFRGHGGCLDMLRTLYAQFVPQEALPSANGYVAALGPPDSSAVRDAQAKAQSRIKGRRMSAAGDDALALTPAQSEAFSRALQGPARLDRARATLRSTLEAEKQEQVKKLTLAVRDFEQDLASCRDKLDALRGEGSIDRYLVAQRVTKEVRTVLEAALDRAEGLNREQTLLDLEVKDWTTPINAMLEELGPYERLWETVSAFVTQRQSWYHNPLLEVEPEQADKQAEGCKANAARSMKELAEEAHAPRALAQRVREEAQRFLTSDLPLLVLLANPGLRPRHWDLMETAVGFRLPHNPRTCLQDMLTLGLEQRISSIEETCVVAAKEYSLEKALERMQSDWAPLELELKSHKSTGTYILSGASVDAVQALLDDHIVKAQTMGASRFAKALLVRIREWIDALTEVQTVLDGWVKVQTQWLYLEPIFSSDDIMQQMPEEGRRFRTVDATWRTLMKGAVADPSALRALRQPGMAAKLSEANELLDLISKGLNSYLETKRLYFPRFFFLSNDELLEILAETKDPTRVQAHLRKCFEGIQELEFDKELCIISMISEEGERVRLSSPHADGRRISPAESRGNVEVWLDWVEKSMRMSVARSVDEALADYPKKDRRQWVLDWAGQAVLAGSQTYWTHGVEKALREGGADGIRAYGVVLRGYINDIIMMVRGDLSKLARKTLSALTVLEVHSRDVTLRLGELGVSSEYDFEWNSQLRYYWTPDGYSAKSAMPGSLKLRMINAQVVYANEYLGNSGRLVITPLTDRCYRTLVGAVHLGYGGAPEGPAGTGKTETTKDLAKAAGMMCVVYNCSDQLGVLEMAKFFKGLASSGAWACFDEFNRIDLEVLSVVAQQVMDIQIAIKERKERFVFYGTEISLRWTANVFITMNPGYAGRSELPDNLKALFRSVAMMVPDYAMISEIILYSYGYLEAKEMARKIVATYKLCSEQLSSQFHYDYGMRAVMAVLRAAGNLKRDPDAASLPEDVLILRAIVDVNLPKFLEPDVPLFEGIARDLFPGVTVPPADRALFMDAMARSCERMGLQLEPVVREKTIQLYEMMIVRHGFMLVGLSWAGKTSSMKILASIMQLLHDEHPADPRWQPIHLVVMNPKSITMGQLYGRTDPVTKEWTNGVLADNYRACATGKVGAKTDRQWVVFDGPVDAIWIENMNTVLDDNKKLCLMSGEIIAMSNNMSMVFETRDLAAASPATVSRCGMVYLEPHVLGWRPVVISWLDQVADDNPRYVFRAAKPSSDKDAAARQAAEAKALLAAQAKADSGAASGAPVLLPTDNDPRPFTLDARQRGLLLRLFDMFVDPVLVLLRKDMNEYCQTQDTTLVWQLTNVLECTLAQAVEALSSASSSSSSSASSSSADEEGGAFKPVPPQHYRIGVVDIRGKAEFSDDDLASAFLFALVWSLGSTTDAVGRGKLDTFIRGLVSGGAAFINSHPLATFVRIKGWRPEGHGIPKGCKPRHNALMNVTSEAHASVSSGAGASTDTVGTELYPLITMSTIDPSAPFVLPSVPAKGLLHDNVYCVGDSKWRTWESCLPSSRIPAGMAFNDIVLPTVATMQFDYLVPLLLTHRRRVLACGPTGTGKSVLMKRFLLRSLPRESYLPVIMGFSAQTSASMTQSQIDRKMERRRKGVYGPRPGQTCIVFVDDLNMPEIETYGAQPPLELLRQMIDQRGWYNLEDNSMMVIEDTFLAAAMGPPGGGRNTIPSRLARHLNTVCLTEIDEPTLRRIFSAIMQWFVQGGTTGADPFSSEVARLDKAVVAATLELYQRAQDQLRPTPAKTHYTFNLRDYARVVQGVLLAVPENVPGPDALTRLWMHEALRVFHDRLINDADRQWLVSSLRELTPKHFGQDVDKLLGHLAPLRAAVTAAAWKGGNSSDDAAAAAPTAAVVASGGKVEYDDVRLLMWSDFLRRSATKKPYEEVQSAEQLVGAITSSLEEYNGQSKSPMHLVPFLFFLEHVSRISRIIKMPGGHALLVGVGGSGRQCSARLAAYMAGHKLMQVELSKSYGTIEWQDDLKRIMKEAGTGPQPVVFLFSDTQIKWQGMVEDLNSILNSGEVPNLFAPDERAEIYEKVQPLARAAGLGKDLPPDELYAYFVERLKSNLHIVLALSPIGDAFRDRLRKFPSLVNCCTIDWFSEWPADALEAVAFKHLQELEMEDRTRASVAFLCQFFHRSVRQLSEDFRVSQRRHNYVTPTSYLELLGQFKRSLKSRRKDVSKERQRYVVGLEKLGSAADQVSLLQRQLEEMQPILAQSQKETEQLMEVIKAKLPGVEEVRTRVKADATQATAEEAEVKAVADECEADLAEALPALNAALHALNTLSEADIKFVRALSAPSPVIRLVMAAVLTMLGEKPDKIKDPDGGMKKVDDFWGPAKRLLGDSKAFLAMLTNYDRDNIDPRLMAQVREKFIPNPEFNVPRAEQAATAAAGMCSWVIAMDKYEKVAKEVAPKRARLAEAKGKLAITQANLAEKQAALKEVEDELGSLQAQFERATRRKEELERDVDRCAKQLVRAEQLITSLGGEKRRWTQRAAELGAQFEALTGDVLLAAGVISYLGAFTMEFRARCLDDWVRECVTRKVPCAATSAAGTVSFEEGAEAASAGGGAASTPMSPGTDSRPFVFSLASVLGNPIAIQQWHIDGLPTDAFSTDNGVIVAEARRWPLMIDPQGQANKWIKNMEKANNLVTVKQTDANFLRSMENAIQFGQPVLLENVGEELDPSLEPVLLKNLFKQGASWCIRLGDATVEYDDRFRLFITTKMRNPHYLPEVSTKVTLLNFMITPAGLQDQLLGVVVAEERPDLERTRTELVVQGAANSKMLSELEARILTVLSESKGNILEDETAIQVLNESKRLSNEIEVKQQAALATQREINDTRAGYSPVASHAARLFFVCADMGNIDPMYQYSLVWFTGLFVMAIRTSKKSDNLASRINHLNDAFTNLLFRNVCRSLFERHKLLFSFLLCLRILQGKGEVDSSELYFLMTGGVAMDNPHKNPASAWLSDKAWGEFVRISDLAAFHGLREHVASDVVGWKRVYDSEAPQDADLPGEWGGLGRLTRFQRLLVLRCIRPDKVVLAVQDFVGSQLGPQYLKPPPFDLKACHDDSNPGQPLVFVLSPGSDPMAALLTFAETLKANVMQISLGQGQGRFAEDMISRARVDGSWVVLQNCHLAPSWMPALEKICEDLAESHASGGEDRGTGSASASAGGGASRSKGEAPHRTFRLWLTSYPSQTFPVAILQNGIKMTNEPPKGLRANIERSYLSDPIADPKFFNGVKNGEAFRRMLFGLCFFHAMVQERRQFGPLGWNIAYEFNESDLRISVRQLAMFLDDPAYAAKDASVSAASAVPYVTLRYLTGECNYGGRVTDDKDRRCLASILSMFYSEDMHEPGRAISPSGAWTTAPGITKEYKDYLKFIDSLPLVPQPEVFGLHANATISKDQQETTDLFADLLMTQRGSGGGGAASGGSGKGGSSTAAKVRTKDEVIADVAADVLGKVRAEYDLEEIGARYPVDPKQSMNTVLTQELARFNRLLAVIRSSVQSVRKALDGLVVMSSTLEGVGDDMFFGRVPRLWLKSSYPSLKPLGGYVNDLVERTTFLDTWIAKGTPSIFWMPGFYFTQSFLTGVLQNFARRYVVPIDDVQFDVEMLSRSRESLTKAPEDGAYVWGVFMDGCRWDGSKGLIAEQEPKQLYPAAPVMWLRPKKTVDLATYQHYECPIYKTTERRGILSTTGHSTNFVMWLRLPTDKSQDHWIRRGVALILALSD